MFAFFTSLCTSFCKSFGTCISKHIVLYHHSVYMLIVCVSFSIAHRVVLQFLACFAQSWSCSFLVDDSLLKISHPFFKWRLSHLVEIVDTHKIISRENL